MKINCLALSFFFKRAEELIDRITAISDLTFSFKSKAEVNQGKLHSIQPNSPFPRNPHTP